jgi:hypothetical protein
MALPRIETPRYELKIPSTGEKVEYRPYLVKEEKILIIALESNDQSQMLRAVRDIISACTFDRLDIQNLALFDLEYVFLKLRGVSVGSKAEMKIKCDACEKFNEVSINLDDVNIKGKINKDVNIKLTKDIGVTMKYPTVHSALLQTSEKLEGYDAIMGTIIASIDSIYDKDNVYPAESSTKQELLDFIESLNQEQFGKLNTFFESLPTLQYDLEFECSSCGKKNSRELKGLQSFF